MKNNACSNRGTSIDKLYFRLWSSVLFNIGKPRNSSNLAL
ncbi:hypothetical protein CHCC20441_4186 [Bacillus licheniformis]|nr:hypothetical protein N399_12390 [Bacillus licheniformis CG-B52]KUL09037.1 hypothetical protein LI17339_16015 [Bacillus licheniformis LMG 17339]KYC68606.1 hypothetical protein B4092_2357 [Bacillus licheniformis]KYC75699.1 hypothetical protein B4090_2385 [Bacillus licheniformis]KYC83871.1 hypothetical protein B4091_2450 [Bacillus licheniformis]